MGPWVAARDDNTTGPGLAVCCVLSVGSEVGPGCSNIFLCSFCAQNLVRFSSCYLNLTFFYIKMKLYVEPNQLKPSLEWKSVVVLVRVH
jgi:hypothetical protein